MSEGRKSLREACTVIVEDAINAVLLGLRKRVCICTGSFAMRTAVVRIVVATLFMVPPRQDVLLADCLAGIFLMTSACFGHKNTASV